MVVPMNQVESPPEQRKPLNSANQGSGHLDMASDKERPGRDRRNVGRFMLTFTKIAILIAVITLCLLASVIGNIFQHDGNKRLQAEVQQLQAEVQRLQATNISKSCTPSWIPYNQSCYLFSDTEANWNSAFNNCKSSGGELLVMVNSEERAFIDDNKEPEEYWIGLQRKDKGEPWKQPDGSFFNNWFTIKGNGNCASLNDGVVSSTDCNSSRRWICRKPLQAN